MGRRDVKMADKSAPNTAGDANIALLLRLMGQAFDAPHAWQGTNVGNALRGVDAECAAWRPQPGRHNIWELVVHMAYWKYRVYRHVTDAPPRSFDLDGSDWFVRPERNEAKDLLDGAWEPDRQLLFDWHGRLTEAVEALDPKSLDEHAYDRYSAEDLIRGIGAHDVYHTGQIQLLKVMRRDR